MTTRRTLLFVPVAFPFLASVSIADEVEDLNRYHPFGWNFVDALRRDGKILWKSKEVVDGKVRSREKLFDTTADFQKAIKASKIGKRADFEVHLRKTANKESYARAEAILKFLRESGYERAGRVSD